MSFKEKMENCSNYFSSSYFTKKKNSSLLSNDFLMPSESIEQNPLFDFTLKF
jgi:hypothetical protein